MSGLPPQNLTAVSIASLPPAAPLRSTDLIVVCQDPTGVQLSASNLSSLIVAANTQPLPVANGGTGDTALTTQALLVGNGTSPVIASPIVKSDGTILSVTNNIGPLPTPVGALLRIAGADGQGTNVEIAAFGTASPNLQFRQARGTAATPTAVQSGDNIGRVEGFAYGATGYGGTSWLINAEAAENWNDAAQGSQIEFYTTTPGTTTIVSRLFLRTGLRVGPATGGTLGDMGVGTINCSVGYFVNGTQLAVPLAAADAAFAAGTPPVIGVSDDPDEGDTGLAVLCRVDGQLRLSRVSVGPPDSGGSGYRMLRIEN